ncbi:mitochondrial small ribosomal subunit Rsm22-domain-containing protein [Xylariaceae sp. FL1651]|nr:mitochondrial small ribosomal subunit Rsm22-domain-containing protein [Xylariaceae sp. FL1651]
MLSAARAQRSCPQCRRQILNLLENTFAPRRPDAPFFPRPRPLAHSASRPLRINSRCFSATRPTFQDPHPEAHPQTPDDIELVVRQARHAFGDTLPKGYLNEDEYKLYERLYGPPLRETRPEDVGMPIPRDAEEEYAYNPAEKILLRETEEGQFEEVVYRTDDLLDPPPSESTERAVQPTPGDTAHVQELPSETGLDYINAVAKNKREYSALLKLQKDFEAASLRPLEEEGVEEEEPLEEDEEAEEDEEDEGEPDATFGHTSDRVHEFSRIGHWRTSPSTLQLPKADFVKPITKLLDRTDIKHVREAAEKAFGGPGLPFSVSTPASKRNAEQKPIPMAAAHHRMSEIEADAFIATMLPAMYSSVMSVLVEIRKRLGSNWMANLMSRGNGDGPRVLDVGAGGAGLAAWEQVLQAEWDLARDGGKKTGLEPNGKKTVVLGSEQLRQRVSQFLHNTTFLPRLPDYLHSGDHPEKLEGGEVPLPRKQFDIIIASHQMLPVKEDFRRRALLDNLWEMLSPEGGILIVIEKGHPRGFEAVADIRARLLDEFIVSPASNPRPEPIEPERRREREPGMIVAPCTNHKACPMYLVPGLSSGRKDFCHFSQRFIRPPFLQKILGATHRNHEDVDFSFVTVQRGTLPGTEKTTLPAQGNDATDNAFSGYEHSTGAPNALSLPRNILPPLKRRGHVTLDLCTPAGTLERWTVPKSFSKQAYRDARKAKWGDLWALGAKTRVKRPVRLGKGVTAPNEVDVRARRVVRDANTTSTSHTSEQGSKRSSPEKRSKSSKKGKTPSLLQELELEK